MARHWVIVVLLAVIGSAPCFADEKSESGRLPQVNSVLAQYPDGTFHFLILPASETPHQFSITAPNFGKVKGLTDWKRHGVDCFYIDAYRKKRVDHTDETVDAGKSTARLVRTCGYNPLRYHRSRNSRHARVPATPFQANRKRKLTIMYGPPRYCKRSCEPKAQSA
jgi:hypothetical protein